MSSPDLPELRARLAASGHEVRKGGRAPLRTLRALLSNEPPRPLLSPAERPPAGPDSRAASPELELLKPGAEPPIEIEVRRKTFGRRAEAVEEPPLLLTAAESAPPVDSRLALPAPAPQAAPAPPPEPFLFQLTEPAEIAPSPPPSPIPPRAAAELHLLLEALERRLRKEQADLAEKLIEAGVQDRSERRSLRAG